MDTHDPHTQMAQALQQMAQTYRLGLRLERLALAMLGLTAAGLAWLIWASWGQTAALMELLRTK